MKYYSDEIVKQIIKDTMEYTMTISQCVPMSAERYPSIEFPDRHGRLKDVDALIEKTRMWSLVRGDEYFELRVNNAIVKELLDAVPTIVEANK